ncbi:MAG: HAD hydrolase family protein [Beduini sp.]|uniref:HAD hydrolase family protein n=1 Tax=Beduini sp. TaxID=1922300 RepID=UPI00399F23A0
MKALISKFENTLYNNDKLSGINFMDANKIKEFQDLGHIFGLFIQEQDPAIDHLLAEHGITADFMIRQDGSILFKEGYQYFDYEPFEKEEIEMILSSLNGSFNALVTTPTAEMSYESETELDKNQIYTCIRIMDCDQEQILAQLKKHFHAVISISVSENAICIFSKKSSLDKSVEVLCGLKNILISDVSMIADYYSDFELIEGIDNLYALKEDNESSKEIYIVDSLGECVDDILSGASDSLFLSIKSV